MVVRIPKNLAMMLAGEKAAARKLAETILMLKAFKPGGTITDKELVEFATVCQLSTKTIERRFSGLEDLGLLKRIGKCYNIASWRTIGQLYAYPYADRFYYWHYDANSPRIEYVLLQKSIYEKKKECERTWTFKINRIHEFSTSLKEVASSLKADVVLYNQLACYATNGHAYEGRDQYVLDATYQRADFNVNYQTISKLFGLHSKGGAAYRKRQLEDLGLIKVHKRQYECNKARKTTKEQRETRLGTAAYFRPLKSVVLTMPDDIQITAHNRIKSGIDKI